jgi:hypothetical protein
MHAALQLTTPRRAVISPSEPLGDVKIWPKLVLGDAC